MNRTLHQLAPDLWVAERPQRFFGVEVGTRMTVIRLPQGELLLYSPVALDSVLREELEGLGAPRFAVAPNRFHHLYAGTYTAAYPELQLFVAPGLDRKRPDLRISGVLDDTPPPGWAQSIEQSVFRGYPIMNEVCFFHRASRTLLTSDLVFNIGAESPRLTRLLVRLIGGRGFGVTALEQFAIRDRVAARASLQHILTWDFDRIILAHGAVLEGGGREAMRQTYAWLL